MNQVSACIVSQQYSQVLSGPGLYTRNLVHGLLARGHQVTLIVPNGAGVGCPAAVRLVEIGSRELARRKGGWVILALYFSRAVRKLIKKGRIDVVHFTDAKEAVFTVGLNGPVIGNVNDSYIAGRSTNPFNYRRSYPCDWLSRWAYQNFVFFLERHALRRLNLNLCNSLFTGEQIVAQYGVPREQVLTCYKSIHLKSYENAGLEVGSKRPKRVLFPGGGNAQRKGLVNLLKAMDSVLEKSPNIELVILGRDRVIPRLIRRYCSARVESRVKHISGVPNEKMKELLVTADCLVMPSLIEAFGVVYLEAMACGTPVIATTQGGAKEFINEGENGLLVDPLSVRNLASAISSILTDRSLRKSLSRNGKETVKRFSTERMLSETITAYSRVIATRRP